MTRPAQWLTDPLDDSLLRYWDGHRWTFHTAVRPIATPIAVVEQPPAPEPALRPDIARAMNNARGMLVGSVKEVHLLAEYLRPEERVLALCAAYADGHGVLACTDRRLLFLFVGVVRRRFLEIDWNQAKHITYNQPTRIFAVWTRKPSKRAVPAMAVRVNRQADAETIASAAFTASAAPRLDVG